MNNSDKRAVSIVCWSGAILALLSSLGLLVWAQIPHKSVPLQDLQAADIDAYTSIVGAQIRPGFVLEQLGTQLQAGDLFQHFNLPLWSLLLWILWMFSVLAFGVRIADVLLPDRRSLTDRIGFGFGLGLAVSSILLLLFGVLGFATRIGMVTLLSLGLVNAIAQWKLLRDIARDSWAGLRGQFTSWPTGLTTGFFLAILAGMFIYAMTPPIQSDGVRYHLAAVQEFLKLGRITFLPHNAFSNFPFLLEMHFMLALGCNAPEASQFMHFTVMLAAVALLLGACRRFVPESTTSTRLLSVALYVMAPASLVPATWPFIDQAVTLYFFGTVYAFLIAFESGSVHSYILAGLMAGGALATKYTALPFAGAVVVMFLVEWIAYLPPARTGARTAITTRKLIFLVGAMFIIGTPWYSKNAFLTGNPVYPLANGVFSGGDWTAADARFYAAKVAEKGSPLSVQALLETPADASIRWARHEGHFLGSTLFCALSLGFAGFCLTLLHGTRMTRPLIWLTFSGVAYFILWFATYQSNRMLVPAIAFAAPLICLLLSQQSLALVARLASAAILLSAAQGGLWSLQWAFAKAEPATLPLLLGQISPTTYMSRGMSSWQAFDYLNDKAGADKVLLIGEHRVYGARFNAVWSDWFDTPAVLAIIRQTHPRNAEQLEKLLARKNIRWVMYNEAELKNQLERYFKPRFQPDEWNVLQQFLSRHAGSAKRIPPGVLIMDLRAK